MCLLICSILSCQQTATIGVAQSLRTLAAEGVGSIRDPFFVKTWGSSHMRKTCTVLLALMLAAVGTARGQAKTDLQTIESARSIMCEYTAAIFDSFIQNVPQNSTTIIVGERAFGETSAMNRQRVVAARSYWLDYYRRVRLEMRQPIIIAAAGVDSNDEGRLTFYVDGRARLQVNFKKNRKFHTSPCYEEPKGRR